MKQQWEYCKPVFEADKYHDVLLKYAPWAGHRRFGYDLVSYYEPEKIVELGSHYGCSAFSFMQAVKDKNLDTKIYTVDLWEAADRFTRNDYEQNVFEFFSEVRRKEFEEIHVEILQMSFDDANEKFEDQSIDILHIDGSHDYQDVKHDFELWLSKVKEDGVILLHDVSEQAVFGEIMGSAVYWKELKENFKYTEEMPYSWGLGILFLSEEKCRDFKAQVDIGRYLQWNLYEAENCKDKIRQDYFKLQDASVWINSLKKDKKILEDGNQNLSAEIDKIRRAYEKTIKEKDAYIAKLQNDSQLQNMRNAYESTIQQKDGYITELEDRIAQWKMENRKIREDYEHTIKGKDDYIEKLEQRVKDMGSLSGEDE